VGQIYTKTTVTHLKTDLHYS